MEERLKSKDPAKWVEGIIKDFINHSPENTLRNAANDKAWADPLVGFSRGDDPIFQSYKEHVGTFHWTPQEVFSLAFPGQGVAGGELSVISWVLPQTEKTKADLRKENTWPSESWARARIFGEETNVKLRQHVVATLKASGIDAVSPMLFPQWERKMSDRFGFASTWSERHAAYASGLGTFGLCDGLITPLGQAMRCGSVVARLQIAATPRPYKDHHAYCLFFSKGTCGKCIERCPAEAVSRSGHDKEKCRAYIDKTRGYISSHFGIEGYGCGFCQSGTPCESKIPALEDVKEKK